jgi:hypothetical protein
MKGYGEPKTFTLDYGQMNQLFELIEEARHNPEKRERVDRLDALRNELQRHLD